MTQFSYSFINDIQAKLPEIPEDSIVSRTVLDSSEFKATIFGFAAGQEMTEHTAAYPAILHAIKGQADLRLAGDSHQAEAGTWVHMPAKLPHSLIAKEEFVFLLVLLK